jgi:hypothetical protein
MFGGIDYKFYRISTGKALTFEDVWQGFTITYEKRLTGQTITYKHV